MFLRRNKRKYSRVYRIGKEVIYDTICELADTVYHCPSTKIFILGNPRENLRVIACMHKSLDMDFEALGARLTEIHIPYSNLQITTRPEARGVSIDNVKVIEKDVQVFKLNEHAVLELVTHYLADDNFYGGYSAQMQFVLDAQCGLLFLGIIGDANSDYIEQYDLDQMERTSTDIWGDLIVME